MKAKLVTSVIAILFLTSVYGKKFNEVTGFQNPESVIAYKDHLFVSNTGEKLEPLAKDGDGYISMLSRTDGKIIELKFISDLNSPKGMYIHKGVLYVADVDKVLGYNIKTKKKVFEADLSKYGVTYANDITKACHGMYVSATLKNAIFKVKYKGKNNIKEFKTKGAPLNGVNGLYRKCVGKISVANYGRNDETNGGFGRIGVVTKKYKEFKKTGVYDGIVRKCGKLYVTDWVNVSENSGRLLVFKKHCAKHSHDINIGTTIGGPSDIYADKKTKLLWIPAMRENKIVSVAFADLKKKKKTK
jgi:hypothetical protein